MKFFGKASTSTTRVRLEEALKHLLDCDESGRGATVDSLAGALTRPRGEAAEILGQLRGRGLATATGDAHQLTEDGRLYALQVVRTHRLCETWLARETSTPAVDWHREAHKAEHHLEAEAVDAMADRLNNPRFDPHGDPIPTREGEMPRRVLVSLASWPACQTCRWVARRWFTRLHHRAPGRNAGACWISAWCPARASAASSPAPSAHRAVMTSAARSSPCATIRRSAS